MAILLNSTDIQGVVNLGQALSRRQTQNMVASAPVTSQVTGRNGCVNNLREDSMWSVPREEHR